MGLNVERFMKVKQLILDEPARMDMGTWKDTDVEDREIAPPCGTVACLAGWAAISARMDRHKIKRVLTAADKIYSHDVERLGGKALGLGYNSAYGLFHEDQWPDDLRIALNDYDPGTPAYAAVVAQAIDRYVACDGDWANDKGAA